jgi:hypothetical protein
MTCDKYEWNTNLRTTSEGGVIASPPFRSEPRLGDGHRFHRSQGPHRRPYPRPSHHHRQCSVRKGPFHRLGAPLRSSLLVLSGSKTNKSDRLALVPRCNSRPRRRSHFSQSRTWNGEEPECGQKKTNGRCVCRAQIDSVPPTSQVSRGWRSRPTH